MTFIKKNALYIAWFIALVAMCGSLFFSNVLGYPPCVLCWYQRIAIYPLVLILGVAIFKKDMKVYRYVLPLSIVGGLISVFHNLVYFKILPDAVAPCAFGVSCTTHFIEWFGFVTIPFLSLVAFIIITVLMFIQRKAYANN
jgi:disulfide bond formation protein DsbB